MKQPLKEKLKQIGGGHLLKEGYAWERKFGEKLTTLDSVQNKYKNKVNEASYSPKEVKNIIWDMKEYVDKLVKVGVDFSIFQNAKASAKALKQIQKLLRNVGQEITMKLTKQRLKEIIKEELLREAAEIEDVQDQEAHIFDVIIQFKKTFEKSEWKKNRKINSIIKQLLKLESQLGNETGDLE